MTSIYFVRHAQPDVNALDDRTRPLTPTGMQDSQELGRVFHDLPMDRFISSPYRRSMETITPWAQAAHKAIFSDERLRERRQGEKSSSPGLLDRRWKDFDFCEKGGEPLRSVQQRNTEALREILQNFSGQHIVIGTHGTALSTIMNHYDPSLGGDWFRTIWHLMPYVIRLDFDGQQLVQTEELFSIQRGYL